MHGFRVIGSAPIATLLGLILSVVSSSQVSAQVTALHTYTEVSYDIAQAGDVFTSGTCGTTVTDDGRMDFNLIVTQQILDDMENALAAGGHVRVEFGTLGQFSLLGRGSGKYTARVLSRVVHAAGGVTILDRGVDHASASHSGVEQHFYNRQVPLTRRDVDRIAVGDTLNVQVRATARVRAGTRPCQLPDEALAQYIFNVGGRPTLVIYGSCLLSLAIDDFSSGPYDVTLTKVRAVTNDQRGSMIGGHRLTRFQITASELSQPATLDIAPGDASLLAVNSGIRVSHRLQASYGAAAPLNLNLSCFSKFRVHVHANDLALNFNMHVTAGNNPVTAECSVNIPPSGSPFFVDVPFSCFAPSVGPSPNFSEIDTIDFVAQTGGAVGAGDYAITLIEAVP